MGVATAAIVGGSLIAGGVAGGIIAGNKQANAAQAAALAQRDIAQQQLEYQQRLQERALRLSQASPQELASIQQILGLQQKTIAEGEKALQADKELLASVDPALKEAGKQAYELLQGKEAAALGVIRKQRDNQRGQLAETLKNRLGAGYETSTAGAAALAAFDQQTAETLQGAQQQTLGSLLGLSAQVRPDVVGKTQSLYSTAANIGAIGLAGQQNIAARNVNALLGSKVDYSNVLNTAGAPYVGDYLRGQQMGQVFSGLAGIGGGILGGAAYGASAPPPGVGGGRV